MALDPRYGSRKTREFMTGGLAGQVVLNSRVSLHQASALHVSFIHCILKSAVLQLLAVTHQRSQQTSRCQFPTTHHATIHCLHSHTDLELAMK